MRRTAIVRRTLGALLAAAVALSGLGACERAPTDRVQGYVEGEFVYVASPLAGELEKLSVARGAQVQRGDLLFALESAAESAERDAARRRLDKARAELEDAKKGKRPTEIDALEALLRQAQATHAFAEQELVRQENLSKSGATSAADADRARTARDQQVARIADLQSDLATAKLGARTDQIESAEQQVHAVEAELAHAEWNLEQKRQTATQAGAVFDTLYREGEWVAAGRPVAVILPPANVKVRAFVKQTQLGSIHTGDPVRVFVDGAAAPFAGHVSFISSKVEYTPPVIYSQESREKLVVMIEARFDDATAAQLHPGQPVDLAFGR
jgi:HlyD family secretion protein